MMLYRIFFLALTHRCFLFGFICTLKPKNTNTKTKNIKLLPKTAVCGLDEMLYKIATL